MSLPHQQSSSSGVVAQENVGYQDGATSPRNNAMVYRQNQITQQQNINGNSRTTGGGRRKYRGGSSSVVVPSFPSSGPPVSSSGQDANSSSQSTNTTNTQSQANASCDSCIGDASNTTHCQSAACNPNAQTGGGGCNGSGLVGLNQTWGCMSGGKRRRTQNRRSRRKKGGMEAVRSAANWVFAPAKQMYNDVTGETERKKQEDHFRRQSDKLDAQFEEDRKQDYLKRSKMLGNKVDLEGYKKQREDNDRMKEENRTHQSQEKISKRGGGKRTYRKSRKGKKSKKVKKSKKAKKSRKSRK